MSAAVAMEVEEPSHVSIACMDYIMSWCLRLHKLVISYMYVGCQG